MSFEIYTGVQSGTTWDIIHRLIRQSGLGQQVGRRLFMDNFYTTMLVVKNLCKHHGWTCAGTVAFTKKKMKKRTADDFPFTKLSNGSVKLLDRGWMRCKVTMGWVKFVVQGTMWKGKEMVGFCHTVGVSQETVKTKRCSKGQALAKEFDAPLVQDLHKTNFNGVDLSDKDSAKHSTSLCTNWWYLRVFFWLLDRVVHSCFLIVKHFAENDIVLEWKQYLDKNNGRKKFQAHLGIALINRGIEMDWKKPFDDSTKPAWMPKAGRGAHMRPCGCDMCFFCLNNKTQKLQTGQQDKASCNLDLLKVCKGKCRRDCVVCKKIAKEKHPGKTLDELRKITGKDAIHQTECGCIGCNKTVCGLHWDVFKHGSGNH